MKTVTIAVGNDGSTIRSVTLLAKRVIVAEVISLVALFAAGYAVGKLF